MGRKRERYFKNEKMKYISYRSGCGCYHAYRMLWRSPFTDDLSVPAATVTPTKEPTAVPKETPTPTLPPTEEPIDATRSSAPAPTEQIPDGMVKAI